MTMKNRHSFLQLTVILMLIILSACSLGKTNDVMALQTQAVQTAQAQSLMQTSLVEVQTQMQQTVQGTATDTPQPTIELPTLPPLMPTNPPLATLDAQSPPVPPQDASPVGWPTATQPPTIAAGSPAATAATGAAPQTSPTASGADRADYASETVPDGTQFLPGQEFTKVWRLQNTGITTWTTDYAIVFDSGSRMDAPEASQLALNQSITPGMVVEISLQMKAPQTEGRYKGYWKLRNADGQTFGVGDLSVAFWVDIIVSKWAQ